MSRPADRRMGRVDALTGRRTERPVDQGDA